MTRAAGELRPPWRGGVDARLDLGGQQCEALQEVLVGKTADVHLENVPNVAEMAVQVDDYAVNAGPAITTPPVPRI
jgi:hypothetical protein